MTPKEKAKELVERYYMFTWMAVKASSNVDAKQCALIAVDEVLFTLNEISEEDNSTYAYHTAVFYNEVKQEIEKL